MNIFPLQRIISPPPLFDCKNSPLPVLCSRVHIDTTWLIIRSYHVMQLILTLIPTAGMRKLPISLWTLPLPSAYR
jgi:hypothetical protein